MTDVYIEIIKVVGLFLFGTGGLILYFREKRKDEHKKEMAELEHRQYVERLQMEKDEQFKTQAAKEFIISNWMKDLIEDGKDSPCYVALLRTHNGDKWKNGECIFRYSLIDGRINPALLEKDSGHESSKSILEVQDMFQNQESNSASFMLNSLCELGIAASTDIGLAENDFIFIEKLKEIGALGYAAVSDKNVDYFILMLWMKNRPHVKETLEKINTKDLLSIQHDFVSKIKML